MLAGLNIPISEDLMIIFSAVLAPSVSLLLVLLSLFGWMGLSDYVRAEFLRNRQLDYVKSARALGVGNGGTSDFFRSFQLTPQKICLACLLSNGASKTRLRHSQFDILQRLQLGRVDLPAIGLVVGAVVADAAEGRATDRLIAAAATQ